MRIIRTCLTNHDLYLALLNFITMGVRGRLNNAGPTLLKSMSPLFLRNVFPALELIMDGFYVLGAEIS